MASLGTPRRNMIDAQRVPERVQPDWPLDPRTLTRGAYDVVEARRVERPTVGGGEDTRVVIGSREQLPQLLCELRREWYLAYTVTPKS